MLHIVWLFLKIVGGLILTVLGVILLLLALILLVPVRYQAAVARYASATAEVRVSWLFRFVECLFSLDTGQQEQERVHIQLRIAFFCIYDNLRPKKIRIKKKRFRKTKEKEPAQRDDAVKRLQAPPQADAAEGAEAADEDVKTVSEGTPTLPAEKETIAGSADSEQEAAGDGASKPLNRLLQLWQRARGWLKRLAALLRGIAALPERISRKISALAEKTEKICRKKDQLMAIYHDEENHRWIMTLLARLKRLLLRLMPKIDRLYWHFGFDDPSLTGRVLGMLSMFYGVCGERMVLEPEFGEKAMEGEIRLHGSIQLLQFVIFAVTNFLNRRFFSLVKQLKNIK